MAIFLDLSRDTQADESCNRCRFYSRPPTRAEDPELHRYSYSYNMPKGKCVRYPPTLVSSVSSHRTSIYDGERMAVTSSAYSIPADYSRDDDLRMSAFIDQAAEAMARATPSTQEDSDG